MPRETGERKIANQREDKEEAGQIDDSLVGFAVGKDQFTYIEYRLGSLFVKEQSEKAVG